MRKIEDTPEETRHSISIEELRDRELGSLEEVGVVEDQIEEREVRVTGRDLDGGISQGIPVPLDPESDAAAKELSSEEYNDEDMGE